MSDNAPRITLRDIEDLIVSEHYFTAAQGAEHPEAHNPFDHRNTTNIGLEHVTFCVLRLRNGFKVVGVNTGPVSPANFDADLGRRYARDHAIERTWELEGYLLRQRLHESAA